MTGIDALAGCVEPNSVRLKLPDQLSQMREGPTKAV